MNQINNKNKIKNKIGNHTALAVHYTEISNIT